MHTTNGACTSEKMPRQSSTAKANAVPALVDIRRANLAACGTVRRIDAPPARIERQERDRRIDSERSYWSSEKTPAEFVTEALVRPRPRISQSALLLHIYLP